ncbi:MAG: Ig-like domain-containing protein [Gammaproteobacteria bacterium]
MKRIIAALSLLAVAVGCESDAPPLSLEDSDQGRRLQLAFAGEVEVVMSVGGFRLNTSHGTYSASLSRVGTTHGGSAGTKLVTRSPATTSPTVFACGTGCSRNINISDGIEGGPHDTGDGIIWNGVYKLTINRPGGLGGPCSYEIIQNHVDTGGDTFFDTTWGDQKLTLNFPTGAGCPTGSWTNKHTKAGSPLSVSVSAPTSVNTNQVFTVSATSSGGFGSHRYVSSFNAGSTTSVNFAPVTFGTASSWTHSYSTPGTYIIAVAAKDAGSRGGNYALGTRTITVGVASVTVSPSSATLTKQNRTVTLTATLRDGSGNIITGPAITWATSNINVASIMGTGSSVIVTGGSSGTATITATSQGKHGSSKIYVFTGF